MKKLAKLLEYIDIFYKYAALDFGTIARKVKNPIVVGHSGKEITFAIVEDHGDMYKVRGGGSISHNKAEMSPNHSRSTWPWKVAAIWADAPMMSLFLFGAMLAKAGHVVSDTNVSPAAQMNIKRYWDRYKNDPNLIVPEVLAEDTWNTGAPWLRAGYLGESLAGAYTAAFAAGEEFTKQVPLQDVYDYEQKLWDYHYGNAGEGTGAKTGIFTDPKAMRETRWLEQVGVPADVAAKALDQMDRGEEVDWEAILPTENGQLKFPEPRKSKDLHLLPGYEPEPVTEPNVPQQQKGKGSLLSFFG